MSDREQRQADEARWAELMVAAQSGDAKAYETLLGELFDVVRAYLRRFLGDSDLVDDCMQEALTAMHRVRHTYDPRRRFRPWLFSIVKHKAIDVLRRQSFRAKHEIPGEGTADGGHEPHRPEAGIDALRSLSALNQEHREALVLTKLLGYSTQEAAREAGISASAMKSRVHRALQQIAKLMEGEFR